MSMKIRSDKQNIFPIGLPSYQINGANYHLIDKVLSDLFSNIREVKLTVSESANLVIRECIIYLEDCVWRELQKNCKKIQVTFNSRENIFKIDLDNLFDIAHADAFERIKIKEDKLFFLNKYVFSWDNNAVFLKAKRRISHLRVVNDIAERAVKLMQDFNGLITDEEEQKLSLLCCDQEHRELYPDCKKLL